VFLFKRRERVDNNAFKKVSKGVNEGPYLSRSDGTGGDGLFEF
jgi:hypothetical protein